MNSPTYPPEGTQKRIILDELLRANGIPLGVSRGKDAQGRSITISEYFIPQEKGAEPC